MSVIPIITTIISIISICVVVMSFILTRKDKDKEEALEIRKDSSHDAYDRGRLEEKVDNISKQLDKVLVKLDDTSAEIENKVNAAIDAHIKAYHNN